jgi:collagenase-like PrtC family protease
MKPPIRLVTIRDADELGRLTPDTADGVLFVAEDFANPFESGLSMNAFRDLKREANQRGLACYAAFDGIVYEADLSLVDEWLVFLQSVSCDGVFCFDETVGLRARSVANDLHVIYHPMTLLTHSAEADFYASLGYFGVVASVDLTFSEAVLLASQTSTKVGCLLGTVPVFISKRKLVEAPNLFQRPGASMTLQEESRPGRIFPVAQNDRGTMVLRDRFVDLPSSVSWCELPFEWLIGFRGAMPFETYMERLRRIWGYKR